MKKFISIILLSHFLFVNCAFANTYWGEDLVPYDRYEKFNGKVFNVNLKINRIIVKNIHIIWASAFPIFLIDCLNRACTNLEYPKRLISCLLQNDIHAALHETKRFIVNTAIRFYVQY